MRLMEKAAVGTVSYKRKSSQKNYVEKEILNAGLQKIFYYP
jgi:hypothetical protein